LLPRLPRNQSLRRALPLLAGAGLGALVLLSVLSLHHVKNLQHAESVAKSTLERLSMLRANAEIAINKRVHLTLGLRAHVASNPDLTESEFAKLAAALMKEGEGIRSITLIKDNVINDVYPRAGNEKAIGLELLKHPKQRQAALHAIRTGQPWLDGPIRLVQGGEAFINRAPVYTLAGSKGGGESRYWGMVSILIDKDTLVSDIVRHQPRDLEIAIRKPETDGNTGFYILGDDSIEARSPLELAIALPAGAWELVGVPAAGWPNRAPSSDWLRLTAVIVSLASGCLLYSLLRSIRELKIARQGAEAASVSKSQFLANMSHEIRTPMTAILGFVETLQSDEEVVKCPHKRRDALQTIQQNGEHLLSIINDILDISKIEAGKMKVESILCSPPRILAEVVELMRIRAEERRIDLRVEAEGRIPEWIESDPTRLRQILVNLIGNGLKFTEKGCVTIRPRFVESPAPRLEFEVADTGIGMSSEQVEVLLCNPKLESARRFDSGSKRNQHVTSISCPSSSKTLPRNRLRLRT